ncbi:hypothetical protein BH18ACT4_BH18ACT4_08590 [soil metagenome]
MSNGAARISPAIDAAGCVLGARWGGYDPRMVDEPSGRPVRTGRRGIPPTLLVGALLAAAVVTFVFQNTHQVSVEWLMFEAKVQLWVVLLITAAVALVIGELIAVSFRRRHRRR